MSHKHPIYVPPGPHKIFTNLLESDSKSETLKPQHICLGCRVSDSESDSEQSPPLSPQPAQPPKFFSLRCWLTQMSMNQTQQSLSAKPRWLTQNRIQQQQMNPSLRHHNHCWQGHYSFFLPLVPATSSFHQSSPQKTPLTPTPFILILTPAARAFRFCRNSRSECWAAGISKWHV